MGVPEVNSCSSIQSGIAGCKHEGNTYDLPQFNCFHMVRLLYGFIYVILLLKRSDRKIVSSTAKNAQGEMNINFFGVLSPD